MTFEKVSVEVWAECTLVEFKQVNGYEATENIYLFFETDQRKVNRGKHGCGEVPCFKIGTLHFMGDSKKEPIDRRDEGGVGYLLRKSKNKTFFQ